MKTFILIIIGAFVESTLAQTSIRDDDLYYAIINNELTETELYRLLDSGMSPDSTIFVPDSGDQFGLFELALSAKNETVAIILLEHGVDVDEYSDNLTPISQVAIVNELNEVAIWLLEHNPDDILKIEPDYFPIALAVGRGDERLVQLILEKISGHTSKYQETLLVSLAISISKGEDFSTMTDLLMDGGANMESNINLILEAAIQGESEEFVNIALAHGADPDFQRSNADRAIFQMALDKVIVSRTNAAKANLKALLQAGADPCAVEAPDAIPDFVQEYLGYDPFLCLP